MKIKMWNPSQKPPVPTKVQNQSWKDMDVLCTFKIKIESQNLDHGCNKDQWPYPNQDQDTKPQSRTSSILKSPKSGLKDIDVLCTIKIKTESRNLDQECIIDQWPYQNKDQDAKPSQEPPVSSKAPNEDLKDIDVLRTFKIKIESKKSYHGCIKDQWPYRNKDQDFKIQSGTSSVLQISKWGPKGHRCSLYLQNQDREPKFGSWVHQISRCQPPVRNIQRPPKTQMRT